MFRNESGEEKLGHCLKIPLFLYDAKVNNLVGSFQIA